MDSIPMMLYNTVGVWKQCLNGCHGVQEHLGVSVFKLKMWEVGCLAQGGMRSAWGPDLSISEALEHAQPLGHADLRLLTHVGCMCVGAREVIPKRRAQKVHVSIVEHQGESVAHSHEPRRSGRLLASSELPRHV